VNLVGRPVRESSRWTALVFIALAQLVIALDVTVVNIALPSAQADLGMSDGARQWIIAAYTLAFGGLLLFGGRVADLVGHKRTFVAGLGCFALASALGGAAGSGSVLIAARVLQGMCGAVLTPSALALVTTTFTQRTERAKAFGVYSAVASSGLALGLIVGGLVTQYLTWRWAFYLSVPCAVIAGGGALAVVSPPGRAAPRGRLDVPGALLATTGLVALVLALAEAQDAGWRAPATTVIAAVAVVLLATFVAVESRVSAPLLPLRVVTGRSRVGVYLAVFLAIVGLFGLFLFMTYYLQVVRGFSPLYTGLAFLPLVVSLAVGATQVAGRLPNVPPRLLMCCGFGLAVAAMLLLTGLRVDSGYLRLVLPAEILLGVGLGMVFVPATNLSTGGVAAADSGVASAVYVTVQQLGAAIGTVILNGVATAATARYAHSHTGAAASASVAIVHGFTTAIWWTVVVLVVAALTTVALVGGRVSTAGRPSAVQSPV
jgi:EmrB/QacA subfamily drug resistance transporter